MPKITERKRRLAKGEYRLWDLRVKVFLAEALDLPAPASQEHKYGNWCHHVAGSYFEVFGGRIAIPDRGDQPPLPDGHLFTFSMYGMAALLALLPAMQRMSDKEDWMNHDNTIACPDPYCLGRFKIERLQIRIENRFEESGASIKPG